MKGVRDGRRDCSAERLKSEVEQIALTTIKPDPRNARRHTRKQINKLAGGTTRYGWSAPIVVDENCMVLAGHARLEAAKVLELTSVPCIRLKRSVPGREDRVRAGRHLALNPFGQIPTYEEGDLILFETDAIVFHIAQRHGSLLLTDADARVRAITWMSAALNTMEPPVLDLTTARIFEKDKSWAHERLPLVEDRARVRLGQHPIAWGCRVARRSVQRGQPYDGVVLLRFRMPGLLDEHPNLAAYVARGEARPAYQRAFATQLAINAPQS